MTSPKTAIKSKILGVADLWNRITDASKIIEMQSIIELCEQHQFKKPKCVLLSLAFCYSGIFSYAPKFDGKLVKIKCK